ncbi:MAG: hypothetical protein MI742_13085 [Desulfobacterales bacterium]|nr:hypothetical protein [Desulfobacterales bacterium]
MGEVSHDALNPKALSSAGEVPFWLIQGEGFLVEQCLKRVVVALLPDGMRDAGCDVVEGDADLRGALEQAATFSLFSSSKVVVIRDSHIFYTKKGENKELFKIAKAHEDGKMPLAARRLAQLLSKLKLGFKHMSMPKGQDKIKVLSEDGQVPKWLSEVSGWAEANGVTIPEAMDDQSVMDRALKAGLPSGHHLVVTTDTIDKRKALYKSFKALGTVVDCSAPKGDRKADKEQKARLVQGAVGQVLAQFGKRMEPRALAYLSEMTGFDLRVITGDVERLCSYVGARPEITLDDARKLAKKTKQDPIYELTGAISERNGRKALACVRNLTANETHPLQILAALVNQVRRLLLARSFLSTPEASRVGNLRDYRSFQNSGVEAVKASDEARLEQAALAQEVLGGSKKKSDLVIHKGGSPYPTFLLLQNASRFSMDELKNIYGLLAECDRTMKSSPEDPGLLLDRILLRLCGGA